MSASASVPSARRSAAALQGQEAGVVTRLAAAAVDLAVVLVVLGAIYLGVAGFLFLVNPRRFSWPNGIGLSVPAVAVLIAAPYLAVAWSASGRTVGNLVLGLRVSGRNGSLLRPGRAMLRALTCLFVPIGLFWIPVDPFRRSLQDLIFGTSVTYDWWPPDDERRSGTAGRIR